MWVITATLYVYFGDQCHPYIFLILRNYFYTSFYIIQVSSVGIISFRCQYLSYLQQAFPISKRVIAPYWDHIDLRFKGSVKYKVIKETDEILSCLPALASDFISSREGIEFQASWVLVARWVDVCPAYSNITTCIEVSSLSCMAKPVTPGWCDRYIQFLTPQTGKQLPGGSDH